MTARLLVLLGTLLGIAGVAAPTQELIKAIAAAGVTVIIAVYQWQHHATVRNADTAAADIKAAAQRAGVEQVHARVAHLENRFDNLTTQLPPAFGGTAPAELSTATTHLGASDGGTTT